MDGTTSYQHGGFWNFLGAGVFGFLINTPIVSYYEHATYSTSNHGHAALMGVYGMLSVTAILFSALAQYFTCGKLEMETRWDNLNTTNATQSSFGWIQYYLLRVTKAA
ncbi:hypothetical protein BH10CYA1_BH10CYA1_13740 [soil metagenome]